ncbi:hypothetical protein J5N97_026233 [Dioscorea zingiberensis]|uniref:DOG1 domain-containing protein n=1 Tax=Dioscorea zingiberensis TaxID=325984 RepID=A0A9D5C2H2_9LILI|nr:hypothetical protein J5N97_026233 [Dioscorea zingiberensis]
MFGNCLSHHDEMMNLKNIAIKTGMFSPGLPECGWPLQRSWLLHAWLGGGFRQTLKSSRLSSNPSPKSMNYIALKSSDHGKSIVYEHEMLINLTYRTKWAGWKVTPLMERLCLTLRILVHGCGLFPLSFLHKIILSSLEPLTEQQLLQIYNLQQSAQENEESLSQGLESLQQSLSNTILSEALSFPSNMADYMDQMAIAMNKLSSFETFVRQDGLRQQTLHRLHQILTSRQAARGFLAIAEYFHRLRALSSLWLARPRQAD